MSDEEKSTVRKRTKPVNMASCSAMSMSGNLSVNWKKWHQTFKLYLRASSLDDESDDRKVAIFLHLIGDRGLEIFNTFQKDEDSITYNELITLFENYFVPKQNLTYETYKFFTCKQSDTESLEEFACNLKTASQACNFDKLQDRLVKIMFICHLHPKYSYLQEQLLLKDELDMEGVLKLAITIHQTRAQAESLQSQSESSTNVNYVKAQQNNSRGSRSMTHNDNKSSNPQSQVKCSRCGQFHRVKCPAIGAQCRKCGRMNHFEVCCRSKSNVLCLETEQNQDQESLFVGCLNSKNKSGSDWVLNIAVKNKQVECLLDTGSDINVMSKSIYDSLNFDMPLSECNVKVKSYTNNSIKVIGSQNMRCEFKLNNNNVTKEIKFFIADVDSRTVIGKETCTELGLVKRVYSVTSDEESNVSPKKAQSSKDDLGQSKKQSVKSSRSQPNNLESILSHYDHVFSGLGCLPGECHITIDPKVPPKIDAPRKVPFAIHDRLKTELEKMEKLNVIVKVTEATKWVNSIVVVEKKNGQLRICLEPRNLNQAIQRTHYPIPSVDMVRSKVAGAKYYSTLDASSGFWMIQLDEESSYLTTFNTPFGRYRFLRLPYGVNCAPEFFHRVMTEIFGDIPGVSVYSDDILVCGKTLEEHNDRLRQVFDRAEQNNVKFNQEKCSFAKSEVKYLGHVFSGQGITADPDKVRAVKNMPSPTCAKDLQRFLGMLNYLSPFINNLAAEVVSLRELLKKNTTFIWNSNYENIFQRLKHIICSAPVLTHFDVNNPITLSVDASSTAVGAVLLQKDHPVYYISKTLTESQQRMAQIEKELYAIVFACIRFHQFIYGQTVKVETDHHPLITLFKKPLAEVPTRLQRMMMKIQAYNLNVEYKKGTEMYIADTLSRAPLSETETTDLDDDIVVHVNLLIKSLPVSSERLEWLKAATNNDEAMQTIKKFCKEGWPSCKNKVPENVKMFWSYKYDLHTEHDLVLRSNAIVIPKQIQPEILKIIHSGHLGVERSKAFARGSVFWPFMSTDIKNLVESCPTCLAHRNANPPEPLKPHEVAMLPWEKVGVDFLDFNSHKYIVIEDYYSNYIELISLSVTNAKAVIATLKSVFSRHGIPVEIISDNGPPFNSAEFKTFVYDWGIQHTTSSPYLPRSNGLVESGVKICKRILTKCEESGSDPYIALLQYRNTPRGNLASPAQLLMSRTLRTQLPAVANRLKPKVVKDHYKAKKENIEKMKESYDKKARKLEELKTGESVYFKKKPDEKWVPGKIKDISTEPRSYILEGLDGFIGRRNRQHIIKTATHESNVSPVKDKPVVTTPQNIPVLTSVVPVMAPNVHITRSGRISKQPNRLDL